MDFFVAPFASFSTATVVWLVTRQDASPANTVAVCESLEAARKRAVEMARYHESIGRPSRVLLREDAAADWVLIWPPDESAGART
ncbi:MAG TPA: hypothetical protein VFB32_13080 [Rudaea sp.]|nr:hypothetical protein [Rudaea sp.]